MTGEPKGPPQFVHMGIADVASGVHAFGAVAAALFHKSRTGRGQAIDVALVDSLYHMHEVTFRCSSTAAAPTCRCAAARSTRSPGPRNLPRAAGLDRACGCSTGSGRRWSPRSASRSWPANPGSPATRCACPEPGRTDRPGRDVDGRPSSAMRRCSQALERHRVPCGPVLSPWRKPCASHSLFATGGAVRGSATPIGGEVDDPGSRSVSAASVPSAASRHRCSASTTPRCSASISATTRAASASSGRAASCTPDRGDGGPTGSSCASTGGFRACSTGAPRSAKRWSARRYPATLATSTTAQVEIVAEGEAARIEELIAWCRVGPRGARVAEVDVRRGPADRRVLPLRRRLKRFSRRAGRG